MLGVRADITPQVARIDAHSLAEDGVTRLCYAGSTLHTRPKSPFASRSPIQLGAELYGDNSLAADVEVIRLMLATLDAAGMGEITLDLGHVGVYKAVLESADLTAEQEETVFDALQRKSLPDLQLALEGVNRDSAALIIGLLDLHGDEAVLAAARELFADSAQDALAAVDALQEVATDVRRQRPIWRSILIWQNCAATTTTPGLYSPPTCQGTGRRWPMVGATTMWVRSMAGPGQRPALPPT